MKHLGSLYELRLSFFILHFQLYISSVFTLTRTTPLGRRGVIHTPHGDIDTPVFMPVGTAGAMKGITHRDLEELGASMMLCNTYHLHLDPGEEIVRDAGGLHSFIGWNKPILTDSGGFQVFSMRAIRSVADEGVHFRSHKNGAPLFLGPEEAITIQHKLGSDIIMCFDECPPSKAPHAEIVAAVDRTLRWAKICKETHEKLCGSMAPEKRPLLFGIVQGGLDLAERKRCAEELVSIGFDGYAIGGLAVGESETEMLEVVRATCPLLPADKPRYLMGVGKLEQMRDSVKAGIDMFDCVLPMREARHGSIYLSTGERIRISSAAYAKDHSPIDPDSSSPLSQRHSKSYLRHLLHLHERYGETIACLQNMGVTLQMVAELRRAIEEQQ
jgi:queuine tRNA-ribosyltransferase